jgi:hypothetical protein
MTTSLSMALADNMAGVKDFIKGNIKFGEDSNDQLSTAVCVEQEEIEIKEDPNDLPFCAVDLTEEKFNVEEGPYDQFSSVACVKHSDEEVR